MNGHRIASSAISGIARYRRSELAARTHGCCRFSPSCSHYAEQALQRRALPIAVLLVLWRVLRCRPGVPRGTWDPVPRATGTFRRKAAGVLVLSGLVTLGTASLAQAIAPRMATQGGCIATINGKDIGAFNRNNPLVVDKGMTIQVAGQAPGAVRAAPEPAGASAVISLDIKLVSPYGLEHQTKQTSGYRTFGTTENVDDYLKYGSGLYRVDAIVVGTAGSTTAYNCHAIVYVQLEGSDVPSIVAGVIALAGLGAGATAQGKSEWAPEDTPPAEAGSPDEIASHDVAPDDSANRGEDLGEIGCFIAILAAFGIVEEDFLFFGAAMAPLTASGGRRFRRRGHPVRGFLGGLLAGWGIAIAGQQQGYWILTLLNALVLPLALAVVFGWRGWRGRAFTLVPR
jgi:putative component of membrane protein insertase Oxa1/YidC/SpoIIIJ protein YidD